MRAHYEPTAEHVRGRLADESPPDGAAERVMRARQHVISAHVRQQVG